MTKKIDIAKARFINESGVEFDDITCKTFLRYNFPNGQSIEIQDPVYMATLPTGENLVYDAEEISYKIRPSKSWWKTWGTRTGCANFVKDDIRAQAGFLDGGVQQINS